MIAVRFLSTVALCAAAAACTPTTQEELTKGAARAVVKPVVAERLPGVPTDPAVDCIIDNATRNELLVLAADTVTGPTASTAEMVSEISSRPATRTCLVTGYGNVLLGGLI